MLEYLCKNNKLEYIHIATDNQKNIVKLMTISFNIQNLRFFYINNYKVRVDITLDISQEYPKKL